MSITVGPMTVDDKPVVAEWLSNPQINRWLYHGFGSTQIDDKFLRIMMMNPRNKLLILKEDGESFGIVLLMQIDDYYKNAMLMWAKGKPITKSPLAMQEGAKKALAYAFEEVGLRSVHGYVYKDNFLQIGLLERLGFKLVGTYRKRFLRDGQFEDAVALDLLPEDIGLSCKENQ